MFTWVLVVVSISSAVTIPGYPSEATCKVGLDHVAGHYTRMGIPAKGICVPVPHEDPNKAPNKDQNKGQKY